MHVVRILRPLSVVSLIALFACDTDDGDKTNTETNPDPIVTTSTTTTGTTTTATTATTATTTSTTTTATGAYLDPESVPIPDPALYDYSAGVYFQMEDISGGYGGETAADDPTILCDEVNCPEAFVNAPQAGMMAIDSDYGHWVQDFLGAFPEDRDFDYDDGFVGDLFDQSGVQNGIMVSSAETFAYQAGYPRGSWCGGLGAEFVKCSTEHYVTMEHALTCFETVPYLNYDPVTGLALDPIYDDVCFGFDDVPQGDIDALMIYEDDFSEMAESQDYAVTLKDDGKYLYRWGTWEKKPTDVRLTTTIELPAEWKTTDVYRVTRAELAVVHTIANSPNDQIRPEDLENEAATGRLPGYTVEPDGTWLSTVDCFEPDGHFIPAGTVLKNPAFAIPSAGSADLIGGFTNAWYTTIDRNPFEADPVSGIGPRWRLQAPKYGQDIPGLEISTVACAEPPVTKSFIKYPTGDLTATVINLLDWDAGVDSPLLYSTGWIAPTIQDMSPTDPDLTVNGVPMTEDFDLSMYVKGEHKTANLYKVVLYLDYELVN